MEQLAQYIKDAKISRSDFAKKVGISAPYLTQILSKDCSKRPSLDVAVRIAAVTNGAVPVEGWVSHLSSPTSTAPSSGAS